MSVISLLPSSTTRLLGSPSVITTPVALVKELLDNAIDAQATAVEVLISPDTVSKIEVRDNGIGIHFNDYDSLGRPGHTSKLRSFEELRTHGGKTLGFRGEALAAANTMGKITVITKTAEDPVGAMLHLVSGVGGVNQQQKASVPVGTTVRITELFGRLPVREQVAIKESTKTLDKILELLRTYAMARPAVKLSFKVFQTPKKGWSYSPKRDASIKEAVLQIAGNEVATRCIEKVLQVDEPRMEIGTPSGHQTTSNTASYTFEAYIMDPETVPYKMSKQHYFSVDGRPVSAKRGTMKKILETYTTTLASSLSSEQYMGYFIRLNITCPKGSYDPNVEPSKDEVLFTDENFVRDRFEVLCKEVYKYIEVSQPSHSINSSLGRERNEIVDVEGYTSNLPNSDIDPKSRKALEPIAPNERYLEPTRELDQQVYPAPILKENHPLPQRRPRDSLNTTSSSKTTNRQSIKTQHNQTSPEPTADERTITNLISSQWKVDMSTDLNEHPAESRRSKRVRPTQEMLGFREEPNDTEIDPMQNLNPWIIAKANASTSHQICDTPEQMVPLSNKAFNPLLTPEPPILQHRRDPPGDLDVPHSLRLHRTMDISNHDGHAVPGGPYRSPMSNSAELASEERVKERIAHPSMGASRNFRSHQHPFTPPSSVQRPSGKGEKQYDLELSKRSDDLKQTRLSFNRKNTGAKNHSAQQDDVQHHAAPLGSPMNQSDGGSVDMGAVFSSARQQLDQQLSQQNLTVNNNRRRERRKSFSQLRSTNVQSDPLSSTVDKEPVKTTLPTGDPRAYLLRRQKSVCAEGGSGTRPKLRRVKSSLMPLENSPEDDRTLLLILVLHYDTQQLLSLVSQTQSYDNYITQGELGGGIDMSLDEGHRIEERLKTLLPEQNKGGGDEGNDVDINLGSSLKGKGLAVDI